jgi:hypothetical protein
VLTYVDVPGVEGPVAILDDGNLFHSNDARLQVVNHGLSCPVRLAAVSRCGSVVIISDESAKSFRAIATRDGSVTHVFGNPKSWYHSAFGFGDIVRPQAVRNKFSKIFVDPGGRLVLVSRKSESMISLSADGHIFLQSWRTVSSDKRLAAAFRPVPGPQGCGYSLQVAKWQDGSLAWLDSRGMLHLKSSDTSLPEMTLVLRDGALAGWTSEGRTFGMAYFAGEARLGTEMDAYQTIVQMPHVLAGRGSFPQGSEAEVYQNILQRFVALLL